MFFNIVAFATKSSNVKPMTADKFDLKQFLPYQLSVVASKTSKEFSTLYRQKFDISIAEWRVIAHLAQSHSVSVREIHEKADMEKSKVSRAVTRLQQRGFVEKKTDPKDKRLLTLRLTENGRGLFDEIVPIAREYESKLLRILTDQAQFQKELSSIIGT